LDNFIITVNSIAKFVLPPIFFRPLVDLVSPLAMTLLPNVQFSSVVLFITKLTDSHKKHGYYEMLEV
jgi:hypothetical protein